MSEFIGCNPRDDSLPKPVTAERQKGNETGLSSLKLYFPDGKWIGISSAKCECSIHRRVEQSMPGQHLTGCNPRDVSLPKPVSAETQQGNETNSSSQLKRFYDLTITSEPSFPADRGTSIFSAKCKNIHTRLINSIPVQYWIVDALEIVPNKLYNWRDWRIVLDDIYLYLWSHAAVLDLCTESGGWFRFILDREIKVMHSSGDTVNVPDECRNETLEKLRTFHQNQVKSSPPSQPIFTTPRATLLVGNWSLICGSEGEISIHHLKNFKHAIILKEYMPGFIFESRNRETFSFVPKESLHPEFSAGCASKKETLLNRKSKSEASIQKKDDILLEDAVEIVLGKPYHWRDWNIVLDEEYFLLWSDAALLQLSKGHYGWFRFIINGKIALMLSDGTPLKDLEDYRREIQGMLQAARQNQKETGAPSQPILSVPGSTSLVVGPWLLFCKTEGEIRIHNSTLSKEAIVLKEDLPGFIFDTDEGGEKTFTSKESLSPELADGWAKKKEKRFNTKSKLKDLKSNENISKPKVGKCSYCNTILNMDILSYHEKECIYRPTNCPSCSATLLLKDIDNHWC